MPGVAEGRRETYDRVEIPKIKPDIAPMSLYRGVFPGCIRRFNAAPLPALAHCQETEGFLENLGPIIQRDDPTARFYELKGAMAAQIISAINSVEPKTKYEADNILVIDHTDGRVAIAYSNAGCVYHSGIISHEDWAAVLDAAFNGASTVVLGPRA